MTRFPNVNENAISFFVRFKLCGLTSAAAPFYSPLGLISLAPNKQDMCGHVLFELFLSTALVFVATLALLRPVLSERFQARGWGSSGAHDIHRVAWYGYAWDPYEYCHG